MKPPCGVVSLRKEINFKTLTIACTFLKWTSLASPVIGNMAWLGGINAGYNAGQVILKCFYHCHEKHTLKMPWGHKCTV